MENYQNFGEIITVINSHPYKFNIGFYSYKPGGERPIIDEYYVYVFNDYVTNKAWDTIVFKLRVENILWDALFEEHQKNLHKIMISFGLREIKGIPLLSGDKLEKEILRISYCVNKHFPGWALSIDDFEFNINAYPADISQWAESLYEQDQLSKYTKTIPIRFGSGKRGAFLYRINQQQKERIKEKIQFFSFDYEDIDESKLIEKLSADESDILEVKGSLEFDIKRYLDGDNKKERKEELRKEILKTVVAFLNSELKNSKYLIIGIIERDKFKNTSSLEKITDNYLLFGINEDYQRDHWDGFLLKLTQMINDRISHVALNSIRISRMSLKNADLCILHFGWFNSPADRWFYLDKNEFWVRQNNRTIMLEAEKADEYKRHYKYRS